jgi:hypothetical protein
MFKIAKIVGDSKFNSLSRKLIRNRVVLIKKCDNVNPGPTPIFVGTETLFVTHCIGNFVYDCLDTVTFPKVKKIYFASNFCQESFSHRFPDAKMYVSDNWLKYKTECDCRLLNVIVMRHDKINDFLNIFHEEPLDIINHEDL